MNLDIKTGAATDLLLELSIMQPCQQKDQIILPWLLQDKFSIYLYHLLRYYSTSLPGHTTMGEIIKTKMPSPLV